MRKVSEVRLDEDNFVYTVCDDLGIKVILLGIHEIIEESRFWNLSFQIYNLDPLAEIGRLETGSTVSACNVSRSNILSFVSGGERPKFSQNTLVIYDAEKDSLVMDFTFGEPVLKTLLTKDTGTNRKLVITRFAISSDRAVENDVLRVLGARRASASGSANEKKQLQAAPLQRQQTRHWRPQTGLRPCK